MHCADLSTYSFPFSLCPYYKNIFVHNQSPPKENDRPCGRCLSGKDDAFTVEHPGQHKDARCRIDVYKRQAQLCGGFCPTSLGILALNIPVALACYRSVGKRFTLYSSLLFCLTSFLLGVLQFEPIVDDVILNVAFGGFLNGMAITLALKANGSNGGTDFISLYVSNKIRK